jgi:superfamily II DNA/RNA helicase
MKTFEELGLSKELLKVIEELKFKEPSEIQEKAIPLALTGKDIVGGSFTGSGKSVIQFKR